MKKFFILNLILIVFSSVVFADTVSEQARILYAENNIKEAFNLLLSIPEEDRTSQDWLLLGNLLQDEGKSDDAVFMYNYAISTDKKNYKAYYNLGLSYLSQDKPNLALQEFKKSVKYKSDFSYGYYNIGCTYLKLGKIKSAKWEFYKAVDINNTEPDFYYNLAYTFKLLNNEKQAKFYLDIYNKMISGT